MDDDSTIDDTISITGTPNSVTISGSGSTMSTNPYWVNNPYTINVSSSTPGYSGISGSYLSSNGTGPIWTTNNSNSTLNVQGDADFNGDIKWKGRSLGKLLESIEDRLAILQPDPAKLEKYEALQKAYNHYKLMEKLVGDD
jgi:hypothetical protein